MLDTAMSAAVGTLLPADKRTTTLNLTVSYLKPLTIESGPIRAIGRVVDLAERTACAAGEIRDGAGSLAAHAVGLFSLTTGEQAQSSVPRSVSIKPGMWSTIRRTLDAMAS
jgi:acyl-coenzyme A thioesterase PaaI-like protein